MYGTVRRTLIAAGGLEVVEEGGCCDRPGPRIFVRQAVEALWCRGLLWLNRLNSEDPFKNLKLLLRLQHNFSLRLI